METSYFSEGKKILFEVDISLLLLLLRNLHTLRSVGVCKLI